jgi:hypothetical protein
MNSDFSSFPAPSPTYRQKNRGNYKSQKVRVRENKRSRKGIIKYVK